MVRHDAKRHDTIYDMIRYGAALYDARCSCSGPRWRSCQSWTHLFWSPVRADDPGGAEIRDIETLAGFDALSQHGAPSRSSSAEHRMEYVRGQVGDAEGVQMCCPTCARACVRARVWCASAPALVRVRMCGRARASMRACVRALTRVMPGIFESWE